MLPHRIENRDQALHLTVFEAMARAYLSGHFTLEEIGKEFGVSYATVSRAVKYHENHVKCKA